ncbi:MAG TPA: hypothetical protein VHE78_17275, partial [Gemmatimonadaceae bacterium]|nr:hypothetical protein [Gemmatimonadaceae bacterium]
MTTRDRRRRVRTRLAFSLASVSAVVVGCRASGFGAARVPSDGTALFARMHDAYAGKWYRSLVFVQRTVMRGPGGADQVATWYEALIAPDRLRIDIGSPGEGNGVLTTADSTYVVRQGRVTRMAARGSVFLPLIEGVYTQPVARTLMQLEPY